MKTHSSSGYADLEGLPIAKMALRRFEWIPKEKG
jgi:hypothetical protein